MLWGCGQDVSVTQSPVVYLPENSAGMTQQNGILLHQGKPFTGVLYALHADGDTARVSPYVNGREHGLQRGWHSGRVLAQERPYRHGHKVGTHCGWHENGMRKFVYQFADDVPQGLLQEWLPDGRLVRQAHYQNGQEDGWQHAWRADGSLAANYFVKKGRAYGFTGVMNCKSVVNEKP